MNNHLIFEIRYCFKIFYIMLFILTFSICFNNAKAEEPIGDEMEAEIAQGVLPIPDYGGDVWSREYLAGDWGGVRTEWANRGIQFDIDYVQWADAAVIGGKSDHTKYGGNLTYNLNVDLMRLGIIPGAFLQIRAESRYGRSSLVNTGQIAPPNTAALSPTNYSADFDDGYPFAFTNVSYTQFLSEEFGVFFGKLDMYGSGDPNEFSGGRGRTQFANWNFNVGTSNIIIPASTIGAGFIYLPNENLTISSLLISGTECTHSNCFEDLDDKGKVSITAITYQYNLGGLPGGVSGSFAYFWGKDFTEIGSVGFVPTEGIVGSKRSTSWNAGASFWQYLITEESHEGPVNLTDGLPDLEGLGLFGRLYFADEKTNPYKTSASIGIGGRGMIPNRPDDVFGVGYFYNDLSLGRFASDILVEDYSYGYEAFYNFAITPAARFSVNAQYLPSTLPSVEDTTLLSGRLRLVF